VTSLKTFYVRPTGATYGRGDGSDWANAYSGLPGTSHGVWAQLAGGGVFYVAGGSYNQSWDLYRGGTANDKRLYIKRATETEHGSESGWQNSFSSRVILNNGAINIRKSASYITVDGAVEDGIRLQGSGNFRRVYGYCYEGERTTGITLKNLDIQGPGLNLGRAYDQSLGIQFTGRELHAISNLVISQCKIYRFSSALVKFNGVKDFLLEKSVLHDSFDTVNHEDFLIADGSHGIIRWNVMYNTAAQGICVRTNGTAPWYIYGNILYQEKAHNWQNNYAGSGGGIAIAGSTPTSSMPEIRNVHIFNNVFYGYRIAVKAIYSGSAYNNIFYNNYTNDLSKLSHDYNWHSGTSAAGEAHGVSGQNLSPFVDVDTYNFYLKALSSPINQGKDLGTSYCHDLAGKLRGADGTWDMGAYEY
jgi:hypothetical protein